MRYWVFFFFANLTPVLPSGVTRTLRDAQREILSFVGPETYLVGHSLDSDLRALRMVHRRLIDTSELYPSARGAPFKVTPVSVWLCRPPASAGRRIRALRAACEGLAFCCSYAILYRVLWSIGLGSHRALTSRLKVASLLVVVPCHLS